MKPVSLHISRLYESFMLQVLHKNANAPSLFVHINTDVNYLTCEIDVGSVLHGKSTFGTIFFQRKNYTLKTGIRLFFSNIRSAKMIYKGDFLAR